MTAIIIGAVFVLLATSAFLMPTFSRTIGYAVARPVWFVREGFLTSVESVKNFFIFKKSLVAQNASLATEVETLQLKENDYDLLKNENQELKNLLGRRSTETQMLARVLSKPPQSPYDTLVLDVGSTDGVVVGDKVYLSGDVILGLVTAVTPHTSLVTLFSSSSQKEELVLERTGASFEVTGAGQANLEVATPKDTDVLWGDSFVYPSLSPAVVGSVYYIDTTSQSSFKTIYIRIPGNVFAAKWVFVEKTI